MKRIGLVLHVGRPEAAVTAVWLTGRLQARGVEVHVLEEDAARMGVSGVIAAPRLPDDLDLVFVLGGDGTLLRAAETVGRSGAPLLGVNHGHLGFLSEFEQDQLEAGLSRILDDGFAIEERMVLEGEILVGATSTPVWALNDVIVEKIHVGRAVKLAVSLDGEDFVSWSTDGVIVATTTGSTAYSFSAGGPIVSPRIDCLIVTPVSPHGLFNRTIVIPADEGVSIEVLKDSDAASLSADGSPTVSLPPGAVVRLRAGATRIRLAKVAPAPFWRLVRDKFGLSRGPQ